MAFCERQLAPIKRPRILLIIRELPRNSMGKILKGKLTETLKREMAKRPWWSCLGSTGHAAAGAMAVVGYLC